MGVVKSGPGIRGFFAIPHGVLSIVPMLVAPVALTLNLIATLNCQFMEVIYERSSYFGAVFDEQGNVTHVDLDISYSRDTYGLRYWQCEEQGDPAEYESDYPDAGLTGESRLTDDEVEANPFNPFSDSDYSLQTEEKFRAAIAFGFLAILLGGMTMLFLHLATCIKYRAPVLGCMGLGFVLSSIFAFLMLSVFGAEMCDNECVSDFRNNTRVQELDLDVPLDDVCNIGCRLGPGAGMAVAAALLWFIAGIVTCVLIVAGDDDDDDDDGGDDDDDGNKAGNVAPSPTTEEQAPLNPEPEVIYQYEDEHGNVHEGVPPSRQSDDGISPMPNHGRTQVEEF